MTGNSPPSPIPAHQSVRTVLVVLTGLLASLGVVTQASIRAELRDPRAASAWEAIEPRLSIDEKMAAVETTARRGASPTADLLQSLVSDSRSLPLRPEPFLVSAIDASSQGQKMRAEDLLLAARYRDPRSVATRYFLAEQFRERGDYRRSLAEIATLLRLRSGDDRNFAPYFAQVAMEPAGRDAVGALMESDPAMGRQVLAFMANGGAEPELVLALAKRLPRRAEDRTWQSNLVQSAVSRGDLAGAHALWMKIVGDAQASALLRNSQFAPDPAPLPFSWNLGASPNGVAEMDGKGGLSLLFYGRSEAMLAEQMLALSPGKYRLSWDYSHAAGEVNALRWRVTCPAAPKPAAEAALAAKELYFTVPSGCVYSILSLAGAETSPDPVSVTLSGLKMAAVR